MELDFLSSIIKGDNNPPNGKIVFDSSDHVRFQNGQDVSGHNYNCHRRITIEKNMILLVVNYSSRPKVKLI